jgi:hypothetical protein
MILDKLSLLSDEQAITATAASTNVYDLGAPGVVPYGNIQLRKRLGKSDCKIPLLIQVVEDFDNLTSLDIAIETDDNSGFSSPKEVISHNVLLADLVAGYICPIENLPRGVDEQYIRLKYTVNGAAPSQGKITAGFVGGVDGSYQGNP